jgi:hypothetical protein
LAITFDDAARTAVEAGEGRAPFVWLTALATVLEDCLTNMFNCKHRVMSDRPISSLGLLCDRRLADDLRAVQRYTKVGAGC